MSLDRGTSDSLPVRGSPVRCRLIYSTSGTQRSRFDGRRSTEATLSRILLAHWPSFLAAPLRHVSPPPCYPSLPRPTPTTTLLATFTSVTVHRDANAGASRRRTAHRRDASRPARHRPCGHLFLLV